MSSIERQGLGEKARKTHTLKPKIIGSALALTGIAALAGGFYDVSRTGDRFDNKYPPLATSEEVQSAKTKYVLFHKQIDDAALKNKPLPTLTDDAKTELGRQIEIINQDDQRNKLYFNPPTHELLRTFALDLGLGIGGGISSVIVGFNKLRKKRT